MHPAYSIILFTTASGAGYGVIITAAIAAIIGKLPSHTLFNITLFAIAATLIGVGLLSSTLHLGHPERAWRAFSQWKSSWLSREAVAVIISVPPIALFALIQLFAPEQHTQLKTLFASLAVITSIAVIWCTGMIYASLKTIRQWNKTITTPIYILIGCASGATILSFIMHLFQQSEPYINLATILLLLLTATAKVHYWKICDQDKGAYSIQQATGLTQKNGTVRQWETPHTAGNFVMHEMGYKIGRKHGKKLRQIVLFAGFIPAAAWIAITLILPFYPIQIAAAALALAHIIIATILERWLFFAQAQHIVTLYYGEQRA